MATSRDSSGPGESERAAALRDRLGGRSLVLVGMMGAGKSSLGRRLAARLSLPFVDADDEIERAANMTIPEIFAAHGEAYFRDGERRVIDRLLKAGPQVLATGGGAFVNAVTRRTILDKGVSVWLKADFEVLMERVRRRSHRPLLKDPDPEGVMRRLLAERDPVYAEADVTLHSRNVPHDVVVEDLFRAIEHYLDREGADVPSARQEAE